MLRIRFHGRGGQGIKTAGQILGTAGFLSGFQAQDFPLYGAERRGAPIVAYTRIDQDAILERGAISRPDLILIGDETLLDDPIAAPLSGIEVSTALFINSIHSPEDLQKHFQLPVLPVSVDLTGMSLKHLEKGRILSTPLAAAAARMMGKIELSNLTRAVGMELEPLGLPKTMVQKNLDLAEEIFNALPDGVVNEREIINVAETLLADMKQEAPASSAPLILAPGNMALRKTGNWRMDRPEIRYEDCNACWICFVRCPDGAMGIRADGKPVIDYDHCKGCLICAQECPKKAIDVMREVTSWA